MHVEVATQVRVREADRCSSSGVPKAPAALITTLALTPSTGLDRSPLREASSAALMGSPARQPTPTARPSSTRTRSTSTPARTRAPAATARGR